MKLSILIATTIDRRQMFNELYSELLHQAEGLPVEVLYEEDNKRISIGAKRQKLLERAVADYIVFFDSDDFPSYNYVEGILQALESNPDCVGFLIHMTTNGNKPQTCCHSLQYPEWKSNVDGYDYVRNVTHFNPVRRELALQVGFKDLRFGEDKIYSDAISKLCKQEYYIPEIIFHYRYTNTIPHRLKYGFK